MIATNNHVRFEISGTIAGFEVTDRDGRPVTPLIETLPDAAKACADLNAAATRGWRSLARALGAVDA